MNQIKTDSEEVFRQFEEMTANPYTMQDEMELYENAFTQYAFYIPVRHGVRAYWFSCCETAAVVSRKKDAYQCADLMSSKHGQGVLCPMCGRQVVNMCLGRLRAGRNSGTYQNLFERKNVVRLFTAGAGVMIEAGVLSCEWEPGEARYDGFFNDGPLDGVPLPESIVDWEPIRRYYAAPGQVLSWRKLWSGWEPVKKATPFPFPAQKLGWFDPEAGQYEVLGAASIQESSMRYCGIEWLAEGFDWGYSFYGRYMVPFLLLAAKYPQVEMLCKMGYAKIVFRMMDGDGQGFNWRAKTPADFFRLSKADFKLFRRSGLNPEELRQYRQIPDVDFQAYCREKQRLTDARAKDSLVLINELAQRCGVPLHRAVSYVLKIGSAVMWRDYLQAAARLNLDLSRQDVAMPKHLQARHDEAVATVKFADDKAKAEHYRRTILPALRQQYSFAYDGLEIIVPEDDAQIIAEGRALKHCVGGYAARHLDGKLAILFLRRQDEPEKPYITIEMNGMLLVQAHGYRNEFDGSEAPRTRHKEFFDIWLTWVLNGSRRLSNGDPLIPRTKEEKTA